MIAPTVVRSFEVVWPTRVTWPSPPSSCSWIDIIAWECDYPHTDTTWPESPEFTWKEFTDAGCTEDEIHKAMDIMVRVGRELGIVNGG